MVAVGGKGGKGVLIRDKGSARSGPNDMAITPVTSSNISAFFSI